MALKLKVSAASPKKQYAYGESIGLDCVFTNQGTDAVYVIDDDRVHKTVSGSDLGLLLGEVDSRGKYRYFAFEAKALRKLAPGRSFKRKLKVGMPVDTVAVDASGTANLEEVKLSGTVSVRLAVGFLAAPFRPQTGDPRGEFLRAQRLAKANVVKVTIAAP